jgi:hypothetical protein
MKRRRRTGVSAPRRLEYPTGERRNPLSQAVAAISPGVICILYALLLFLRIPVQIFCNLLVVPLLGFAGMWGFVAGWTSKAALVLAGTSLVIFLLAFLFDSLLLWLAPEQLHLDS